MVSNFTYKEIAVILDKDSKQIDNGQYIFHSNNISYSNKVLNELKLK